MANDSFTLSENTNKLLAIYRDFHRVINDLYSYFQDGAPEGEEEDKLEIAERFFKPFDKSVSDINKKLLELIGTKIESALDDGSETNVI